MRPLVFAWPGNEPLAAALAARTGGEVAPLSLRRFPDGETYVRLMTSPSGREVMFACTLDHPDDKITSLLFAADAARELGARRVGLVAPYLAYMRQDARFEPGEAITSRTFARMISQAFDWLVTMDPHLHRYRVLDEIYSIPASIAASATAIAGWLRSHVERPLIIGPDAESAQWAAAIAQGTGAPFVVLQKQRRGDRDVAVSVPDIAAWPQHTPVLVDDIISTARTMVAAVRRLHELAMPAPVCIGVHALFGGDALEALRASGPRIVATCNTIRHETNAIDVAGEIAAAAAGAVQSLATFTAARI